MNPNLWSTARRDRDELLPVATIARRVLGDEAPSPMVLRRWLEKGRHGRTLPVIRRGVEVYTTTVAFRRFIGAEQEVKA
jgi:hypothetical protein